MGWFSKPREEFCPNQTRHPRHPVKSPKTGKVLYICPGVN